jgi:multiple sugar transport system substrate-binding protein
MGSRGGGTSAEFYKYLWGFGGQVFDDKWNPILNQDPGIKAIEYHKSLLPYCPPGVLGYGWYEHISGFVNGQAAMADTWAYTTWSIWLENTALMGSKVAGDVMYAPHPAGPGSPGQTPSLRSCWGICIPKAGKQKDAAVQYAAWLTSDEAARIIGEWGGVVDRVAPFQDAQFVQKWPYFPLVLDSGKIAHLQSGGVILKEWNDVDLIVQAAVSSALAGEQTPKAALDEAAVLIRSVMNRAGYYNPGTPPPQKG